MGADNIILGDGVFSIGATPIALTRGGGNLTIEREYREIDADGDYGPVKGRIRKIRSVARLTLSALELLPANMTKFYPAMTLTDETVKDVLTGKLDIESGDYNATVSWTGTTKAGKEVYIELQNAINLEEINWETVDKEEIVPEITYTATYLENARTTEPWKVEFVKDDAFDVTFLVVDSVTSAPIAGALIIIEGEDILTTDNNGKAIYKNKADDTYTYDISAALYTAQTGNTVVVNGADLYEVIELVAV